MVRADPRGPERLVEQLVHDPPQLALHHVGALGGPLQVDGDDRAVDGTGGRPRGYRAYRREVSAHRPSLSGSAVHPSMMSPGRALLPAGKQALTGVDAFGSAAMRWTRRRRPRPPCSER